MGILEMFMNSQVKIDFKAGYDACLTDRDPEDDEWWFLEVTLGLQQSDLLTMLADDTRRKNGINLGHVKAREASDAGYHKTRYRFRYSLNDGDLPDDFGTLLAAVMDEDAEDDGEEYVIGLSSKERRLMYRMAEAQLGRAGSSVDDLFDEARENAGKNECYGSKRFHGQF